ncbi:MAG: phospholipase D-like domain-containing protein [Candidatus Promineifilaceae bacterium]
MLESILDAISSQLQSFRQAISDNLIAYLKDRPQVTLLGLLILLAGACGGSFLLGGGPVNTIERLFFPTRFVITTTGEAGDWYDVYFTDPPQEYDPRNFAGEAPDALSVLIDQAQDSIHIAAFEFDLTPVADALIDAHDRGVDVKWFTDDEHGLEADTESGHGQFQMLLDAGIPVRTDERQGLMHDKFIVFDNEVVWTGSTNLTRNGMFKNDNNVIVFYSDRMADKYEREFAELWKGKSSSERRATIRRQTSMIEDTPVLVLFAPEDDAMDYLLPLVKQAKESIHFMTFAFTHDAMGQELVNRAKRGVDVKGVFESRNATTEHSEIHRLYCAGIDVLEDGNPANMHHKVFVIDDKIVVTGSYNFSNNSENTNDENLVFLSNYDVAAAYEQEFARVWADAVPPDAAEIICP